MYCDNKNKLLALYFSEGTENELAEIREHVNNCNDCQEYMGTLKTTMCKLDKLEDNDPSPDILDNILSEVSVSLPKPVKQKIDTPIASILQIALGQLFLYAIIYVINLKLTISPIWDEIKNFWLIKSIGSVGIAVIFVLCIGSFITFSLAPILLSESKEKNFSLK